MLGKALKSAAWSKVQDKCCCCRIEEGPFNIDAFSHELLTLVLRDAGAIPEAAEVVASNVADLSGIGLLSEMFRLTLTYSGVDNIEDAPTTLVAKFGSPKFGDRFVSAWLGFYANETGFYNTLQKDCDKAAPGLTPRCYFAETNKSGTRCVVLMEDLAPRRSCDQLEGCNLEQVRQSQ